MIDFVKQLRRIPVGSEYHAHRYDTDDDNVLHVWDGKGQSFDMRISKSLEITEIERDDVDNVSGSSESRISREGGGNAIRMRFPECIEVECESGELSFHELKKETLELLKIAKGHVMKSDVYEHETA